MRTTTSMRRPVGYGLLLAAFFATAPARAVNPLEYPDNGSAQFARGGAWLAVGTDPIAAHYNPATLATQRSAFSIDSRLNFNKICFERTDDEGNPAGAAFDDRTGEPRLEYREACNERADFPIAIPSLALSWRATEDLGFGLALVPPSAYGNSNQMWPPFAKGYNNIINRETGEPFGEQQIPAPYRYMTLGNQSTILYPTASAGWHVGGGLRIGAGFVSGIAIITAQTGSIAQASPLRRDQAGQDSFSEIQTQDLFVPGAVASLHYSVTDFLDVAVWGRYFDKISTTDGRLQTRTQFYRAPSYDSLQPVCQSTDDASCSESGVATTIAIPNEFGQGATRQAARDAFQKFEFQLPAEVRVGIRYHHPRSDADPIDPETGYSVRDPLHDDVFDIELDGSYTANSMWDQLTIRFTENSDGTGVVINPVGTLPPYADRPTGFQDSWGGRLGGQYNVIQDKLALLAGSWIETQSQKVQLMNVSPPGPLRGGVGGGVTVRQGFIDITFGYQWHWSREMNNIGTCTEEDPCLRAAAGSQVPDTTTLQEPADLPAEYRQEFRSLHYINVGKINQSAHVFSLGGVMRF